jgi:hypothetical protein
VVVGGVVGHAAFREDGVAVGADDHLRRPHRRCASMAPKEQ